MFEENEDEFVDLGNGLVDGSLGEVLEWLERWLVYPTSRLVLAFEALRSSIEEVIVSVGRGFVDNLMTVITLIVISRGKLSTVVGATMSTSARSCSHSRGTSTCLAIARSFRIGSSSSKIVELWLLTDTLLEAILEWDRCAFFIVALACATTTAPRLQLSGRGRLPAHCDLLHMLCHLLTADHLAKTLIELLFEENLRLGPAYKYLSDKLGFIEHTRISNPSSLLLLSLSSKSLRLLLLLDKSVAVLRDTNTMVP